MEPVILLCTNSLTSVSSPVFQDQKDLAYQLGKLGYKVYDFSPHRVAIDRARNLAGEYALQLGCTHIWFIDDDMLLTKHTLESLLAADKDIVLADSIIRGYPFDRMAFKRVPTEDPNDLDMVHYNDLMDHRDENGLVNDCAAVGFTCCLIKTQLLKDLKTPWFITSPHGTEDVYFCVRCQRELPYPVTISVDTKVPTYHQLDPLYVSPVNVEIFREFFEKLVPSVHKPVKAENKDRAEEYHNLCQSL